MRAGLGTAVLLVALAAAVVAAVWSCATLDPERGHETESAQLALQPDDRGQDRSRPDRARLRDSVASAADALEEPGDVTGPFEVSGRMLLHDGTPLPRGEFWLTQQCDGPPILVRDGAFEFTADARGPIVLHGLRAQLLGRWNPITVEVRRGVPLEVRSTAEDTVRLRILEAADERAFRGRCAAGTLELRVSAHLASEDKWVFAEASVVVTPGGRTDKVIRLPAR